MTILITLAAVFLMGTTPSNEVKIQVKACTAEPIRACAFNGWAKPQGEAVTEGKVPPGESRIFRCGGQAQGRCSVAVSPPQAIGCLVKGGRQIQVVKDGQWIRVKRSGALFQVSVHADEPSCRN